MLDDRLFDHAQRHDLEARRRLQLGEIRHRHLPAVDRGLVALVEERRHRHAAKLRERIANHRLLRHRRQDQAATAGRRRAKPADQGR